MPITPFHFGPGLFFKSLKPPRFSFVSFLLSQILIDLEPAYHLLKGHEQLHGSLHSFAGSLGIVIILLPLYKLKKFGDLKEVCFSALIGVWSHVLLDSIMHTDMAPFWPFSQQNPFLDVISLHMLHLLCLFMGILGGLLLYLRLGTKSL